MVMVLGISVAGWRYFTGKTETAESKATPESKRKILYWTDPMTPSYRSDKPGKSPFMDMELVPVYEDGAAVSDGASITVRPEIIQNLGVRTYTVTRGSQPRRVAVTGYLFRDAQGSASVAGGMTPGATDARGLIVLVDLIDRDASFVRAGQRAEVRVADVPDRTWG
ncbi:MAG: heavy metal-binding domain-containing protein, partial [Pseudomonadota bacterium]